MPRLAEEKKIKTSNFNAATDLEGVHNGEPAFVIGNGKSAEYYDADKMHDCGITIGCNLGFTIHKLDYLCWQDSKIAHKCSTFDGPKVTSYKHCKLGNIPEQWYCLNFGRPLPDGFAKMNTGGLALQLAILMGCNPIFLVGIDGCFINGSSNMFTDKQKQKSEIRPVRGKKTTSHLQSHLDSIDREITKYKDWTNIYYLGDWGITTHTEKRVDFEYFYSREHPKRKQK